MPVLSIVKHPDPALRGKSIALKDVGRDEKKLMADMAATMYATRGIGLAAPQVALARRVIVVESGEGLLKMVNPRIISKKGSASLEEGCLSVPDRSVSVRRAAEVKVAYIDESNKKKTQTFSGLTARVIQHEIDHLNGKLIIDHLPWYKKVFSRKGEAKCRL